MFIENKRNITKEIDERNELVNVYWNLGGEGKLQILATLNWLILVVKR